MTDGIIKGTGNSRYLKSVPNVRTLYPTWDAALDALIAGTFPIDLNGINPSGWEQVGDKLNKANLLKDDTAALFGLGVAAVPDDVFKKMGKIESGSFAGNSASTATLTFSFEPKFVFVFAYYQTDFWITVAVNGLTKGLEAQFRNQNNVSSVYSVSFPTATFSGKSVVIGKNFYSAYGPFKYLAIG